MHIPGWYRREPADAVPEDHAARWNEGAPQDGVLLEYGDGWSRALRGRRPAADQLTILRRLLDPDRGESPYRTARWRESADALMRRNGEGARETVRNLLEALAEGAPYAVPDPRADARAVLVGPANAIRAVNLVWAAVQLDDPRAMALIGRVLIRTLTEPWTLESCARIRDAARRALALDGGYQARAALGAAVPLAPTSALREELAWSLGLASIGRETPPSRIDELRVRDHGLDGDGARRVSVHRRGFTLRLLPSGEVALTPDRPAGTDGAAAAELAGAEARAVDMAYRAEVERIEDLLATDRDWPLEEWRRLYLGNPITRCVAARTVWEFAGPGDHGISVLPDWTGQIRAVDGAAQPTDWPSGAVTVRLWHPREARPEQLAAWRALLADQPVRLVQPFQQIERDFTLVAPDPDATELDACVGVRIDPASVQLALRRIRWHPRRGNATSNSDAVCFYQRHFPDAHVSVTLTGVRREKLVEFDTAWFHRTDNPASIPLPLGSVPARIYSEALRDLAVLTREEPPSHRSAARTP